VKNRKNDRSDASLHVDHPGDVHFVPVWSPSSHQGGYHKKYTHNVDRALWSVTKTHNPLCIIIKKSSDAPTIPSPNVIH